MADLLECLLQIRGLRESLVRLDALVRAAAIAGGPAVCAADAAVAALAGAESRWQAALESALPDGPRDPKASVTWRAARVEGRPDQFPGPLHRFRHLRETTLNMLDTCSADDLAAVGRLGAGRPATVADMVAHMLAHDTEQLGALRVATGP